MYERIERFTSLADTPATGLSNSWGYMERIGK